MNRISVLNIILAFLVTATLALLVADIIGNRLSHLLPRSLSPKSVSSAPAPEEDLATFAPILEKGLFGKASVGKLTAIPRDSAGAAPAATPLSDLVLLGTVIGSLRETFALVQKNSSKEERVIRLGETVFDAGPLLAVHRESIEIGINGKPTTLKAPSATLGSGPPAGAPLPAAAGAPVTQMSAGSFVIDQKALNAALDNLGQAMTDARLLPSMKDGKVEGFRASEVKPAGIFGMVGIRNGDVLLRMNDFAIDSPEKAIQSLATLKGQTRLKLDLLRDGQPATFSYDIR